MSEDKKPKIDLKARLGKKTVSSPTAGSSGSIPPPAGVGIPRPSGIGGGIPAPPFQSSSGRPAPAVDPSNPYGSMAPAAAPVRAEPTAIRIEMSEEVMQAQKRGRGKVVALALVTAGVGAFIGYALGSGAERGKGQDAALTGAKELSAEVEAANKKIEELADTLKSAREKLGKAKFPEEEVSKLGAINIPFSGSNLSGKGIGRFKSDVLTQLIEFASASTEANDQKETIQSVLNGNKKGVQEFLEGQTKPVVRWSVVVGGSPMGPIASMQPVPAPFLLTSDEKKDGKAYSGPTRSTFKLAARRSPSSATRRVILPEKSRCTSPSTRPRKRRSVRPTCSCGSVASFPTWKRSCAATQLRARKRRACWRPVAACWTS
jgi:hypothetical protein